LKLLAVGRVHAALLDIVLHVAFQFLPLNGAIAAHMGWNTVILSLRWLGAWARPVLYLPAPASLAEYMGLSLTEVVLCAFAFCTTFCLEILVAVIIAIRRA